MLFKSKQQKAGERVFRELGHRLDYETWVPMQRGQDGWICFQSVCPDTYDLDLILAPEGQNWEILVGSASGALLRRDTIAPLKGSASEVFQNLDAYLDWLLKGDVLGFPRSVGVGFMLAKTRAMVGGGARSLDARLYTLLILLRTLPADDAEGLSELLEEAHELAGVAIASGSVEAASTLRSIQEIATRMGIDDAR